MPAVAPSAVSTLPDPAVVQAVIDGQPALFELLMRRHNQRLYRAIRCYLRDEAEVEEAMQDTYLQAFAHLSEFRGAAAFSTWLLRIGINEAMSRRRRAGRLKVVGEEPMEELTADQSSPEDRAAAQELGKLTEAAIDELPDAYRSVFVLREIEGMSTREVGDALGLEESNVKQRLHRAKAQVRESVNARIDRHLSGALPFHATRCDRVVAGVLGRLGIQR